MRATASSKFPIINEVVSYERVCPPEIISKSCPSEPSSMMM
jgi:hypothetical protein